MANSAGPKFDFLDYIRDAFRWRAGRQMSGYSKMLILQGTFPLPFDLYLLRYQEGSEIAPHTDPIASGCHYRLNFVLKRAKIGGEFQCSKTIFERRRIKLFRPDIAVHSVSKIENGSRYVMSFGWVILPKTRCGPNQ